MRKKIPHNIEVQILLRNKHACCICRETGLYKDVVIHHIDGNPNNNKLENLAVLCLDHHSKADIGLKQGRIGAGKKFTPEEIKSYKKQWEDKIMAEIKVAKKYFPTRKKKQMEALYEFEIRKVKNEILSLPENDPRIREKFDYLNQLVVEEFISGIEIRKKLLDVYFHIAIQSSTVTNIALRLTDAVRDLSLHLIGPKEVKMDTKDKKILLESLNTISTIGEFNAEFSDTDKVIKRVCRNIHELLEIASWYKVKEFKLRAIRTLKGIKSTCLKGGYKMREKKITVIDDAIKEISRFRI